MKKMITIFGMVLTSLTAIAADHIPTSQDRYCGKLEITEQLPPACITCTPAPSRFYINVKTRILDELEAGNGFVEDQPKDLIIKLSGIQTSIKTTETEAQIKELQRSLIRMLSANKEYCAEGIITKLKTADERTALGINFSKIYEGTR